MLFNEGNAEQEAMSHTVGEKPCPSFLAEAIGHKNDEETMQKGRKRKGAASESSGIQSGNHSNFSQRHPYDGIIGSFFVDETWIPMWPQYAYTGSKDIFLRLGCREAWLMQMIVARKKRMRRSDDPCKHESRKLILRATKSVAAELVRDLIGQLRDALPTCKVRRRMVGKGTYPEVFPVKIEGRDVRIVTRKRQFHILLETESLQWIKTALRGAITRHMGSTTQATSHSDQQRIHAARFQYLNYLTCVRDLVHPGASQ